MKNMILKTAPMALAAALAVTATGAGAATFVLDDFASPSPAQSLQSGPTGLTISGSGPYSRTITWYQYSAGSSANFTIGDGQFGYTPTPGSAGYTNMAYGLYNGGPLVDLDLDSYHYLRLDMAAAGVLNLVMEFYNPFAPPGTGYYGVIGVNAQPGGYTYIPMDPIRSYFSFHDVGGIRFVVDQSGSGTSAFTLRQIAFTTDGAVPEPASWALMLLGFGLIGATMRAGRTKIRFA